VFCQSRHRGAIIQKAGCDENRYAIFFTALKPSLRLADYFLDSAHLAGFETNLDAMRMLRGFGQNILYHTARAFAGALISFQNDFNG
jgi:hypothetical protein